MKSIYINEDLQAIRETVRAFVENGDSHEGQKTRFLRDKRRRLHCTVGQASCYE